MAVTVRTPAQTGRVERKQALHRGMQLALGVEITIGATGDYGATGIPLAALATGLGFRKILGLVSASVRQSNNTQRALLPLYDVANNSLRLYVSSAAGNAFTEITPVTHLAANDVVSLNLFGV